MPRSKQYLGGLLHIRTLKNEPILNSVHSAFEDQGHGVFRLKPGWSLAFTHAVMTTGDHPTAIAIPTESGAPVCGRSAGDLWKRCTGSSVTTQTCCVFNCPNPKCHADTGNPQQAGATAHVYATFQTSDHDIGYMILLPTCSHCNNWMQCIRNEINFPLTGQEANILYTIKAAKLMFIKVDSKVTSGKGAAGKGTGKGGGYHGKGGGKGGKGNPPNPPGAPPDAQII